MFLRRQQLILKLVLSYFLSTGFHANAANLKHNIITLTIQTNNMSSCPQTYICRNFISNKFALVLC